jgi:hypothetical protein
VPGPDHEVFTSVDSKLIQFDFLLFKCRVNSYEDNYRHSAVHIQVITLRTNTTYEVTDKDKLRAKTGGSEHTKHRKRKQTKRR